MLFSYQQHENLLILNLQKHCPFGLFFSTNTATIWVLDSVIYLQDYCYHLLIILPAFNLSLLKFISHIKAFL